MYHPEGTMIETDDGGGRFIEVLLKPIVTVKEGSDPVLVEQLHEKAHHQCFIANSMNFPVRYEPSVQIQGVV
jgi:organic hydroperoxide reductase OsmC/OhrA